MISFHIIYVNNTINNKFIWGKSLANGLYDGMYNIPVIIINICKVFFQILTLKHRNGKL